MARRKRAPGAADDSLRARLAARWREDARTFLSVLLDDGSCYREPWSRRAARLDAGEPVEVAGWEVRPLDVQADASARYRLEPDGSLTRLRRGPA